MRNTGSIKLLGGCCWCGGSVDQCRNTVMLKLRAPVAGTGWGCFTCGLPNDGAIALACDECAQAGISNLPRELCVGLPGESGLRIQLNELAMEPFDHDLTKHPELQPQPGDISVAPEMAIALVPVQKADALELFQYVLAMQEVKSPEEYSGIERVLSAVFAALIPETKQPGVCQICGCTETLACDDGCEWVNADETLCSACARQI